MGRPAATAPSGVRAVVRRAPVPVFVVLVLALSWPMLLLGEVSWVLVPVTMVLSPAACAVAVTWLADGRAGVRELLGRLLRRRVPPGWYLFALFGMGAAVLGVAYGVTAVLFPAQLAPPPEGVLIPLALNFVVLFLIAGIGEELGWRGFVLPRLQSRRGPIVATLAVGLLWYAWHLPLYVGGSRPLGLLGVFLVAVVADAFVYTWVFNRTGGSVLLVALMHAAGNVWGGHVYAFTFAFTPPGPVVFEYVRIGVYVVAAIAIVVLTRGRLGLAPVRPGRPVPTHS